MNYIGLWLLKGESINCGDCGEEIEESLAYLWGYQENTIHTAEVRCDRCFRKAQADEDIKLLEGVLGQ